MWKNNQRRQRPRPEHGIDFLLNKPISTVKLAAGDVGPGWLQTAEHDRCLFPCHLMRDAGQEGIFNAQTKGATTQHHVMDAVLMHPCRGDKAVLCESVLGLENVEQAACGEMLVALLQRVARAGGVELVGFVEKLERPVHVQVICVVENRKRHAKAKSLEELFMGERLARGFALQVRMNHLRLAA